MTLIMLYWGVQIKAWEEEELDKPIDIDQIRVDPSPFQLVERTSLHKVIHSLTEITYEKYCLLLRGFMSFQGNHDFVFYLHVNVSLKLSLFHALREMCFSIKTTSLYPAFRSLYVWAPKHKKTFKKCYYIFF